MAEEDDLDAFFDEVNEAEVEVINHENQETKEVKDTEAEPPAKKAKTSVNVRPRGVVVAAATSVLMPAKQREELESASQQEQQEHQNQQGLYQPKSTSGSSHLHQASHPATVGPYIGPAFPVSANPASNINKDSAGKKKASVRVAAGQTWVDPSLDEWPDNDYRIFVGNLSNEVTDQALFQHFHKYPSVAKAKVVRHNNNPEKSKGYGFVSFLDPLESARAIREMDQTFLLSRPIRVKRSDWKERDFKVVKKREKKEKKQQQRMGLSM